MHYIGFKRGEEASFFNFGHVGSVSLLAIDMCSSCVCAEFTELPLLSAQLVNASREIISISQLVKVMSKLA